MTELWSWRIAGRVGPTRVRTLLAGMFDHPVRPLDPVAAAHLPAGGVLCDVWYAPGAYQTAVDCYGVLGEGRELAVAAELARRLGRDCLLPDDTLDPSRHLLCAPDGTIRPVHLDVIDVDPGPLLINPRLCTTRDSRCHGWSACHGSRWAPDSVLPGLAAA